MKSGFLGAMAMLFAGAGWVAAQAPATSTPTSPPPALSAPAATGPVMNAGAPAPSIYGAAPAASCLPGEAVGYGNGGAVWYGSAEYILWKIKSGTIPSTASVVPVGLISVDTTDLFTNNPAVAGVPAGTPVVGFAPVTIQSNAVFGSGPRTDFGSQNGARFTLGAWADPDMTWGVEASFFFTERGTDNFAALSATGGNQFLIDTGFTRNLFLVQGGQQTLLNNFPILVIRETRSNLVGEANTTLYGAELNGRWVGMRIGWVDFGGLVGFRYLGYRDELAITNNVRLFRPAGFPVTQGDATASLSQDLTYSTSDRVRLWNHFYGAQAGFDMDAKYGSLFLYARAKLALGSMVQLAQVESTTSVINNDPVRIQPASTASSGGLLAGPNDVGSHSRTKFSWIPELNAKLGYQVASWLRCWVGYDVLYIGHVARTGQVSVINQLDTTVRVAGTEQRVTVNQPTFRFRDQDVWVQGLNFGFEVRY